ncbi:MAG: ADP-dependent glucokinase/phosphofructokinase [Sphaerochaeta sp.]|nr:ADP-dependent glucokinase/phosphofructokinase [Sphaerochaeta sp.]
MALGLANAIDYIADLDSALLQQALDDLSITTQDLHYYHHLNDERVVLATIVQAIAEGQGGERYVDEPSVLDTLALRFPYTVSLGGTATRAANLLAAHSIPSLVHMLSYTEEDRTLIDPLVEVVVAPSSPPSSFHLIIQYQGGLTVQVADRTITAPTANRIILNNNPAIRAVELNPLFFSQAGDCDVLLISGLNAMHSQRLLETRLVELAHYLKPMLPSLPIVYESGCFHKTHFVDLVRKALCPYLTVYSMNEEEWSDMVGSDMGGADADDVRTALAVTSALLSVPIVVIHTKHYVVARGKSAAIYKGALQQGIDWATAAMLDNGPLPGSLSPYGITLHEALEDDLTCCVPCWTVNAPAMTTIGLGDAFIAGFLAKMPTRRSKP